MHETDFSHEHIETAAERAVARTIWNQDNVAFKTVGIDIGSSTSHLLFAQVVMRRQSQALSSRFVGFKSVPTCRRPLRTPTLRMLLSRRRELR
jgi:ethanolamine utilization protein EutA